MWHFAPRMKPRTELDATKAIPAPAAYIRLMFRHFATTEAMRKRLLEGTDIDAERLAQPGAEMTLFSYL